MTAQVREMWENVDGEGPQLFFIRANKLKNARTPANVGTNAIPGKSVVHNLSEDYAVEERSQFTALNICRTSVETTVRIFYATRMARELAK